MEKITTTGRAFFGLCLVGLGIQQFIFGEFRPLFLAFWPGWLPGMKAWAFAAGAVLILSGALIVIYKQARMVCISIGILFLFLFFCSHVYFQFFSNPYYLQLGSWTNALKELSFAGSAFVVASSYQSAGLEKSNKRLFDLGRILFAIMLIAFGIDHFLYTAFVATLVPDWIPGHVFWTYVGGSALVGAGLSLLLNIGIRQISLLLAIMLFIWLIILHLPRAVSAAADDKGNEMTSVFEALGFCGVALVSFVISSGRFARKENP